MGAMGERGRGDGLRLLSEFVWMDTSFRDTLSLVVTVWTRAFASFLVCHPPSRSTFYFCHIMIFFIPHVTMLCFALMPVFMISYLTLSFSMSSFLVLRLFFFFSFSFVLCITVVLSVAVSYRIRI
jgi:hypothetical protein